MYVVFYNPMYTIRYYYLFLPTILLRVSTTLKIPMGQIAPVGVNRQVIAILAFSGRPQAGRRDRAGVDEESASPAVGEDERLGDDEETRGWVGRWQGGQGEF